MGMDKDVGQNDKLDMQQGDGNKERPSASAPVRINATTATDLLAGDRNKPELDKDPSDCFFSVSEGAEWSDDGLSTSSGVSNLDTDPEDSDPALPTTAKKSNFCPATQGRGRKELKWDYLSAIPLSGTSPVETGVIPPILEVIHQAILSHTEEMHQDSRKAQAAMRKMQGVVRKLSKACLNMGERVTNLEERIVTTEAEAASASSKVEAQGSQIKDIQRKLEEFENRQRRNKLRVLGVPEGVEGSDTRAYIIDLFKSAFPEMSDWNWAAEVQRAHRTPFKPTMQTKEGDKPRAILVFFGNFLLRQAISDKAKPEARRSNG